jgi:hypothetical protein
MTAPRWVRKRDNRVEPYDEAKVARAVAAAALRSMSRDEARDLARDLSRSITFFLSRRGGPKAVSSGEVGDAVERALTETGHAPVAGALREHRVFRDRRRQEVRVREPGRPSSEIGSVEKAIEVLTSGGAAPWSKRRIVETLVAEAGLPEKSAIDVGRAVEERVFQSGLTRVSSSLLRELIDAELFERGFAAQLGKLEVVGVPKPDLKRLIDLAGRAPAALEAEVARSALERYALEELIGGDGAAAHRLGDIHLLGLGRPLRLAAGASPASQAVADSRPARDAAEAALRLVRTARLGSLGYDLAFGLGDLGAALAPHAGSGLASAAEVLVDALAAPAPDEVAAAPEVVLELDLRSGDASSRAVALALLDAAAERKRDAVGVRVALVVGPGADDGARAAIARAALAAREGTPVEVVLASPEVPAPRSRGLAGSARACAASSIALVNMSACALLAGPGERDRMIQEAARATESAIGALKRRRELLLTAVARPALPLWRPRPEDGPPGAGPLAARPATLGPEHVADVLGLVGLDAALRYLTGESAGENPRVAKLAAEVLEAWAREARRLAQRAGLELAIEDAPTADAAFRLAALDRERFPEARDLLSKRGPYDPGLALDDEGRDPRRDLAVRAELASVLGAALVLPRSALATVEDPQAFARDLTS